MSESDIEYARTSGVTADPAQFGERIVAKPSNSYRLRWCLMGIALLGWGCWSLYDGYVRYPRENAAARAKGLDKEPHPGWDVPFNKVVGFVLQPLGLLTIGWSLYQSRGRYVLDGDRLLIPGHPSVALDTIRSIDKRLWERKGIAYLDYELPGVAGNGRLKLDDYVYERKPTDEILARIEARLLPPETAKAAADALN